jgi:lipoate-protein ligase A
LIDKIKYIITTETNPFKNLALEEYLLKQVGEQECILYLWQNEKTVVIGKNQNPWKECKVAELEADGGKLVRRLSGGGAVFHDLGNLNFTFLVAKENYNVEKQLEVIIKAVNGLGIPAEKSGRNDITVEGKKFSGNAFYSDGFHSYHHGTILVNVDISKLSQYLNVSKDKLISKGVESVRSRVTNLTSYQVALDIKRMQKELIQAFGDVYKLQPEIFETSELDSAGLANLEEKFSSWEWIYGKKMEFNYSLEKRFAWGDIDLRFVVDSGKIKQCKIYSDSLETDLFELLTQRLTGCTFSTNAMLHVIEEMKSTMEADNLTRILAEIISFIHD